MATGPQSDTEALAWFRKSVDGGYFHALRILADIYLKVQELPDSDESAGAWFRRVLQAGDPDAMYLLGTIYLSGQGVFRNGPSVPQSYSDAAAWYRKAADAGSGEAMFSLGFMYQSGRGVPKSDSHAMAWYRKAADAGSAAAMYSLGWMYEYDQAVPKSDADALAWFRKAANAGFGLAMNNLGVMYQGGLGVPKSDTGAVAWYQKAADARSTLGMTNLASMYWTGRGVPQSSADAFRWYLEAVETGDALGAYTAGVMYQYGRGVQQSYTEAARWFRAAADRHYDAARINLGVLYQNGWGTATDLNAARALYAQAATSKDPEVAKLAVKLGDLLGNSGDKAAESASPNSPEYNSPSGVSAAGPSVVRVGGQVEAAKLMKSIAPVYPPSAVQEGIQGYVRLQVTVGSDGVVQSLRAIGEPSVLDDAAIHAVKQWQYQPTLLAGKPVAVETEVDVKFTLPGGAANSAPGNKLDETNGVSPGDLVALLAVLFYVAAQGQSSTTAPQAYQGDQEQQEDSRGCTFALMAWGTQLENVLSGCLLGAALAPDP